MAKSPSCVSRSNIPDNGLATIGRMDAPDPDNLRATISEVAESFDLGGIGAQQGAFDTTRTRTRRRRSWRSSWSHFRQF